MSERIVAAALRKGELVFSLPRPARHGHIGKQMAEQGIDAITPDQGFLTSEGRYVDRLTAVTIAIEAGQIDAPKWPPDLYSEDLW
jgi:hypothetical protein